MGKDSGSGASYREWEPEPEVYGDRDAFVLLEEGLGWGKTLMAVLRFFPRGEGEEV